MQKIILLMAASFYKWLIFPCLAFFNISADFRPIEVRGAEIFHPIFISVTEIGHNGKDKTLEISCKIFIDDFEKVLTRKYGAVVNLSDPKDRNLINRQVGQYFTEHLQVAVNSQKVDYSFLGFEKEEDVIWCFLEAQNIASVQRIQSRNTLLHDLNNNQINIMHVTVDGKRKSTKLDYPQSEADFEF